MRLLLAVSLLAAPACRKREVPGDPPPIGSAGSAEGSDEGPIPPPPTVKAPVVDEPMFHIRPDEAQVSIAPARAHVGAAGHATVTVISARGFHVSKEYKTKLEVAGAEVTTTRRTEQELAFDIVATPKVAGEQHLDGFLHVGICESKSCRPRKHPISIAVIGE